MPNFSPRTKRQLVTFLAFKQKMMDAAYKKKVENLKNPIFIPVPKPPTRTVGLVCFPKTQSSECQTVKPQYKSEEKDGVKFLQTEAFVSLTMNQANELCIMIDSGAKSDQEILSFCQAAEDIDIDVRDEGHYGRAYERDAPRKQIKEKKGVTEDSAKQKDNYQDQKQRTKTNSAPKTKETQERPKS